MIYGLIQKEKLRQMYAPAPRPTSVSQIPNPFRKTRRNDTTTRGWRRGTGTRACRRSRLVLGSCSRDRAARCRRAASLRSGLSGASRLPASARSIVRR